MKKRKEGMQNSSYNKKENIKGEIQCKIENFVSLPNNILKFDYKNITNF